MSSFLPNSDIKQELLDTLDKLIRHSSSEAQILKETLQSYRLETTKATPSPILTVVKQELKQENIRGERLPVPPPPPLLPLQDASMSDTIPPLLRCSSPQITAPDLPTSQLLSPLFDILPPHHQNPRYQPPHNQPPHHQTSQDTGIKRTHPEDTLRAAQTLLDINNRLNEQLRRVTPPVQDEQLRVIRPTVDEEQPLAKRPRIDLGPQFVDSVIPSSTPMMLVPIPADKIKDLLLNGGVIPPMSLLSALPFSQLSDLSAHLNTSPHTDFESSLRGPVAPPPSVSSTTCPTTLPTLTSSSSPPLLSPTMSSSILRFCERRARVDAVDVFHYLPADARASPFPASKSGNYRNILDDITSTKMKIPKLPKDFEALPKLSPFQNERTVYTPFQTEKLESSFNSNAFLTKEGREALGKELNIHPGRIKVWYQNRRARMRREDMLKEKIKAAAQAGSSAAAELEKEKNE